MFDNQSLEHELREGRLSLAEALERVGSGKWEVGSSSRSHARTDFETEEIERLQASVDRLMKDILAQAVEVKACQAKLAAARAVIREFVYPVAPMTEQQKTAWLAWLEVEK